MEILGYLIVGLALGLPLILGLVFRVGAPHLFFSLMAGELLARYFGHDVGNAAGTVVSGSNADAYGEIALLLAPMLLTSYFLKGSLSRGKTVLHIVPLVITGVVLAAFLLPLLPVEAQDQVRNIPLGNYLLNLNRIIIGVVVAAQLVALWVLNRKSDKEPAGKGKK